ncbi:MAG: ABC transporter substrate-binding protein, partial [Brevibacterium sp.]|nr:ABC transporter substrate-binding protein [Brevibacterium sp.]
ILHNDSPFGTAPVQDAKDWVKEKGLDIDVTSYAMPAGTTNYSGMLSQVDADGADYIMVQNVASPAAQLAKDLADSSGDQKIVCLNWCGNELFVTAAGEAAEGHMMVQPVAPLSADKPGHKEIVDYLEANGGDPKTTANSYVQGWYTMHAMAEGIRATLDGDNELTGANIREALETMGPINTGGVFGLGEIEFSADSHRGSNSAGMYTVEDGKMVEVEGGLTP